MMIDQPPSPIDVHNVAHYIFDTFAASLGSGKGEKLTIGPTKLTGRRSRFAFVRIGADKYRFRLVVTRLGDTFRVQTTATR